MNSKGIQFALLSYMTLLLLLSCEEKVNYVGLRGDLVGRAYLLAAGSVEGIKVQVWNNEKFLDSTSTDSLGWFRIEGLETGLYDFQFSKDSFATYWHYGYQFIGGEIDENLSFIRLNKLEDFDIQELIIDRIDTGFAGDLRLRLVAKLSEVKNYAFRLYFGSDENVSYTNYQVTKVQRFGPVAEDAVQMTLYIGNHQQLDVSGYEPGEDVYIRAYPEEDDSPNYLHKETGLTVYPVNENAGSNVIKITMPELIEQ